jgi:hypothetical protein
MGRYRPAAVGCIEPVRERGRDAFWEQEIEAPAARGEARKGKIDFLLAPFAPAAGGSMKLNGIVKDLAAVLAAGPRLLPPRGWRHHIEAD